MDITRIREEYSRAAFDETDALQDPFRQFGKWFDEALASKVPLPNAMTLATVGADHAPSARIVLLKGFDESGFVFFTNYDSRKGRELAANPRAALQFFWPELERQVRIEGMIGKVAPAESDEYYITRPLGSRLGAWASPQSQTLSGRPELEERFQQASMQHGDNPARPPHWGGYRLQPALFEFWQGRASRLHDRLRYSRTSKGWDTARLAP